MGGKAVADIVITPNNLEEHQTRTKHKKSFACT